MFVAELALDESMDIAINDFDLVGGTDKLLRECGVETLDTSNIMNDKYRKALNVSSA